MEETMRPRLSFANLVSVLALFVALGGSAYAFHLGKNSVGSKQLRKNAVTTAKVKNGAVTGEKINVSTLPKVPSATRADHAVSAETATGAGTAINATNATNALNLAAPEAFHLVGTQGEPQFENGYENFTGSNSYAPAEFYRDRQCLVHLEGLITGPSEHTAFT